MLGDLLAQRRGEVVEDGGNLGGPIELPRRDGRFEGALRLARLDEVVDGVGGVGGLVEQVFTVLSRERDKSPLISSSYQELDKRLTVYLILQADHLCGKVLSREGNCLGVGGAGDVVLQGRPLIIDGRKLEEVGGLLEGLP